MKITEVRDLDGPNLFLPGPAIKLELDVEGDDNAVPDAVRVYLGDEAGTRPELSDPVSAVRELIVHFHDVVDVQPPEVKTFELESPGHIALAWPWSKRRFAKRVGQVAAGMVSGDVAPGDFDAAEATIRELWNRHGDPSDVPEMIRTAGRTKRIIAITGTNGKTTTSRLISSVLRSTGLHVGLTSSVGVFIDGNQVLEGDYSGPAGAHRVFEEASVDVAVLETARGGMLLRGLAFEHADVGVVTNVSADHLGLHGIYTIEGLAKVKAIVARYVHPAGRVVLNADDARVLSMRDVSQAAPFLVTRKQPAQAVRDHIERGGWALTVEDGNVVWWHDGKQDHVTRLSDVPITFDGRAPHMVENALCAAAALLAFGLNPEQVRSGLEHFRSSSTDNRGRLNVFTYHDATVIIDFAHNEVGLENLVAFARGFVRDGGKMYCIIGTAGDREDSVFKGIGAFAAGNADVVMLKDSKKYLRGREKGDMLALMRQGVESASASPEVMEAPTEGDAFNQVLERLRPGDVAAVMCVEEFDAILKHLDDIATPLS